MIDFGSVFICVYLLMFGSYCINECKDVVLWLSLVFVKGEFNFYSCLVCLIEELLDDVYDWWVDVMFDVWDLVFV